MNMFKKFAVLFVLIASVSVAQAEGPSCKLVDSAIESASEIRGLKQKRKVPCELHNKDQIRKFVIDSIQAKIPKNRIEGEEDIFKSIGLFPETFDYKKGMVDLYVSQIGGYYDPEKSKYIMADWMPNIVQATIAVHELTHALQDQYFDLGKLTEQKDMSTDVSLARSALIEGDATAVMLDYNKKTAWPSRNC